jgi:hypothetical protein
MAPDSDLVNPQIKKEYIKELLPYNFPEMSIFVPKGFNVIKEMITKVYYKKHKRKDTGATFYLLYEPPGFFVDLFPRLKKQGIKDDYEFFRRIMSARLTGINDLTDAFFVISKGIFIPNLGDQRSVRMIRFSGSGVRGFINCNFSASENYFDCNLFSEKGDFFKIYIKDKDKKLDLDKLAAIISTVRKTD